MSCSEGVESATESSDSCLVNNYSLLFTEKMSTNSFPFSVRDTCYC
jgi:hypothetical protein